MDLFIVDDFVKIESLEHLNKTHSLIEFFMGFQNITKLLKSNGHNLNYSHLKLKPLRYSTSPKKIFLFVVYNFIIRVKTEFYFFTLKFKASYLNFSILRNTSTNYRTHTQVALFEL